MKKVYIAPTMGKTIDMDITLLTNSQPSTDQITGPEGTGYGGVDETGGKDPSSRFYQGWNEEEEEF